MSEAKSYHVTEAGLIEGQALGRISVVLRTDFDNATRLFLDAAERCVASGRREKELQKLLTSSDEQVDRLKRVAHLAAEDSAALQKRVRALTEALNQICGWCGAFLDDDMDMPKASVKALRSLIAKALPIHGELPETH